MSLTKVSIEVEVRRALSTQPKEPKKSLQVFDLSVCSKKKEASNNQRCSGKILLNFIRPYSVIFLEPV